MSSFLCEGFLYAAIGGHSSSRCTGLSLSRPLLLRSTGSRCVGSVVVAHGPSSSTSCGIFPDQASNPFPRHWQADSQPLHHHGSPHFNFCSTMSSFSRWGNGIKYLKTGSLVLWLFHLVVPQATWPWPGTSTLPRFHYPYSKGEWQYFFGILFIYLFIFSRFLLLI